jgi:3-oxoadipate enol-lactonase
MAFAKINGVDLYYDVYGAGPAMLLSHGVGSNHRHWWQQIPRFSKKFKVIVFDHRGFGLSGEDGKGPKSFADDVRGLLDHLRIDKAAMVGQSMGGITVTGFASRFPERVSALMLSCSGGGVVPVKYAPEILSALQNCKTYLEFSKVTLEQDGFQARHPELSFLFESLTQLNDRVDLKLLSGLRDLKHDVAPIAAAGIPTLLIGGEDDHGVNDSLKQLKALIPGAQLEMIENAGHLLFFESAQRYNHLVETFLCDVHGLAGAA